MDSILQKKKQCCICGRWENLDSHHVYSGANRKRSEKYGLKVWLCHSEHHIFGKNSVHRNADIDRKLKKAAQKKAMLHYGWSVEEFIKIFGKNYL